MAAGHGMDKRKQNTTENGETGGRIFLQPVSCLFLIFFFFCGERLGERVSGDHGLADRGVGIHGGFHLGTGQPGVDAGR